MGMESIFSVKHQLIRENGRIIFLMGVVNILGLTAEDLLECGKITKFTAKENFTFRMGDFTMDSSKMIKNTESGLLAGQVEKYIKEPGKKKNNMEKVRLHTKMAKPETEFGKMEKEFDG